MSVVREAEEGTMTIRGKSISLEEAVLSNQKMVYKIALRYQSVAKTANIDFEDVVSVGNVGLLKALKGFDDSLGFYFSTYAYPMITGEILQYIRSQNPGIRYSRKSKEMGWLIVRKGLADCSIEEIAEELNEEEEAIVDALLFLQNRNPARLDRSIGQEGEQTTLHDIVSSRLDDLTQLYVDEFLEQLSERDRDVTQRRMNGQSQVAIAKAVGLTQAQVSRILKATGELYRKTYSLSTVSESNSLDNEEKNGQLQTTEDVPNIEKQALGEILKEARKEIQKKEKDQFLSLLSLEARRPIEQRQTILSEGVFDK